MSDYKVKLRFFILIADLPSVPVVDLTFVVAVGSVTDANANYRKIKDIIKKVIDHYGKERIGYSLIVSGETPLIKVRFSEIFPTDDSLKAFVDSLPIPTRVGFLDKALEKAKELFKIESRSVAEKILVVISDKKSESDPVKTQKSAEKLDDNNIVIIAVALDDEDNTSELKNITSQVRNFIKANRTFSTKDLADLIMDRVEQGRLAVKNYLVYQSSYN